MDQKNNHDDDDKNIQFELSVINLRLFFQFEIFRRFNYYEIRHFLYDVLSGIMSIEFDCELIDTRLDIETSMSRQLLYYAVSKRSKGKSKTRT